MCTKPIGTANNNCGIVCVCVCVFGVCINGETPFRALLNWGKWNEELELEQFDELKMLIGAGRVGVTVWDCGDGTIVAYNS